MSASTEAARGLLKQRIMVQTSATTWARWVSRSLLQARVAGGVALSLATLSLSSLAIAQEPSESPQEAPASADEPPASTQESLPVAPAPSSGAQRPSSSEASASAAMAVSADDPWITAPPRVHEGFYLRLTSGPCVLTMNGHGPYGSASLTGSGAGGKVSIGGAVAPGFVLAGTFEGSAFDAEFKGGPFVDATVRSNGKTRPASNRASGGFGMVGMLVDWYPRPTAGWHVGVSGGLGALVLTNSADDSDFAGANFSGSVFGGYDWSLGSNWSVGLQLVASGATTTKLMVDEDDTHDSGYRLTPFSVGLQASVLYF